MEHRFIETSKIVEDTAEYITGLCEAALEKTSKIILGVSGGNSPKALFPVLAQKISPKCASCISIIQIDERVVEKSSQDSNQNLIVNTLSELLQKGAQFFSVPILDKNPTSIADIYNTVIKDLFDNAGYAIALLRIWRRWSHRFYFSKRRRNSIYRKPSICNFFRAYWI